MTENVTLLYNAGDRRLVVSLPLSVDLVAVILHGVEATWPGSRVVDTGRDDVMVIDLAEEAPT